MRKDQSNKDGKSNRQPDECAIALGYDAATMDAPRVLAAGFGYKAQKILQIAEEQGIAVEKNPALAEALSYLDPGQEIPPELYRVVAEILVFIMETDSRARKGIK